MKCTCVIIGGGPAGLMAANVLDEKKIDYVLIEKNVLLGKKLLITGGSRCNVTNLYGVKDFVNHLTIPHGKFLYSSLSSFGTKETKEFFEEKGISFYLEEGYKYFPQSDKAVDIRDALSISLKGTIRLNETVQSVKKEDMFVIKTDKENYHAQYVIVATGSKSYPKTGSSGDGVVFAKELGHDIIPFYPAETNVYSEYIKQNKDTLQGIVLEKVNVQIKDTKIKYNGNLLFTHWGLSGPVIQHLSEFIYHHQKDKKTYIYIGLTQKSENEIRTVLENQMNQDIHIFKLLSQFTTKRIAKFLLEELGIENQKIKAINKKSLNKVIEGLLRFEVLVDRVELVENAFVNGGGVSTKDLDPKTFESKLVKGLFFVGETVDVHGPIGGYNITIALSSGSAAARKIGEDVNA